MNARPVFIGAPLVPEELDRLGRIYGIARYITGKSCHDAAAQRLAAMIIRFYQLGVRDEEVLLAMVIGTYQDLSGE